MAGPAKFTAGWPSTFTGKIQTGKQLAGIDPAKRQVSFADGTGDNYDVLISTAPLDLLVQMMKPADSRLQEAATGLVHNNLLVVGLGLKKKIETGRCWIYFTDADMPCYRATYFSHYSPNNVPNGDTETIQFADVRDVVPGGRNAGPGEDSGSGYNRIDQGENAGGVGPRAASCRAIIGLWGIRIRFRHSAGTGLWMCCNRHLLGKGIYSRGRFGAWRYEIGNMDHSVMMGVEAVNNILKGEKEEVFHSS